jgi:hypothetical protein
MKRAMDHAVVPMGPAGGRACRQRGSVLEAGRSPDGMMTFAERGPW